MKALFAEEAKPSRAWFWQISPAVTICPQPLLTTSESEFDFSRLPTDGFGNLPHEPALTNCNSFRPAMATELYFNHPGSCNND